MLLYDATLLNGQLSLGGRDPNSGCCLMEVQLYLAPACVDDPLYKHLFPVPSQYEIG